MGPPRKPHTHWNKWAVQMNRPTLPTDALRMLLFVVPVVSLCAAPGTAHAGGGKPSTLRTSNLHASRRVQSWPLTPVIFWESYPPIAARALILGRISHLDAFSGSCSRT